MGTLNTLNSAFVFLGVAQVRLADSVVAGVVVLTGLYSLTSECLTSTIFQQAVMDSIAILRSIMYLFE